MNFRRHIGEEEAQINLTPLIDVIFMLLVFFILTTSFIEESYIPIVLPQSESSLQDDEPILEVIIDLDGNYIIDGKRLANNKRETIHTALQRAGQDSKAGHLKITADERVAHGKVVVLMDLAGLLDFNNIQITTRKIDDF